MFVIFLFLRFSKTKFIFIYFSVFAQKRLRGHIIVINFILQCPYDQNFKFI